MILPFLVSSKNHNTQKLQFHNKVIINNDNGNSSTSYTKAPIFFKVTLDYKNHTFDRPQNHNN